MLRQLPLQPWPLSHPSLCYHGNLCCNHGNRLLPHQPYPSAVGLKCVCFTEITANHTHLQGYWSYINVLLQRTVLITLCLLYATHQSFSVSILLHWPLHFIHAFAWIYIFSANCTYCIILKLLSHWKMYSHNQTQTWLFERVMNCFLKYKIHL